MKSKLLWLLLGILLSTTPAIQAGIIFGQFENALTDGTITYIAYVGNNWNEILTEDSFNSKLGVNQGYQKGKFLFDAANFFSIRSGDLVTIEFSGIGSEEGKAGSIKVAWNGSFQDQGIISFEENDNLTTPPQPIVKTISPGIIWLNWKPEGKWLHYYIYRSTQASGCNNLSSNGRYQLIASRARPPYTDNTVPNVRGTQAWYLIIAEDRYGRKSGHSPEAYVPDASLWLKLSSFDGEYDDKNINLTWNLAQPIEIQGFNLYRSFELNGKYLKLNSELIKSGDAMGITMYHYIDEKVEQENRYFYYLEAVALDGKAVKSNLLEMSLPQR